MELEVFASGLGGGSDSPYATASHVRELDATLADLQTELTIQLGDCEAIKKVCSFKRRLVPKLDVQAFSRTFPEQYALCAEQRAPQLRKHVYTTRSYR